MIAAAAHMNMISLDGRPLEPTRHEGIGRVILPEGSDYSNMGGQTVIPHSLPSGGIAGKDKWYGIKPGFVMRWDNDAAQYIPEKAHEIIKARPATAPAPAKAGAEPEAAAEPEAEEAAPKEAVNLPMDILSELQASVTAQKQFLDQEDRAANQVRVTLQGAFGKARGMYMNVIEQDDLLILVADADAQIFTPALSEDLVKVTYQKQTRQVHYTGIEFEVPSFHCVFQVFVKAES